MANLNAQLKSILQHRLVPLGFDIERIVHRNGYVRVLFTTILSLGILGIIGQILGIELLRTVFAIVAVVLLILTSFITFAATQTLRERVARSETLVHSYADALGAETPVRISRWNQTVSLEEDGDARIIRELTISGDYEDAPRHLSINLVYYGDIDLTDSDKRRVVVSVEHSDPQRATGGVRAIATNSWTTSSNGMPRLDVYVHLGRIVRDGDLITITWDWPRYSRGLMTGRSPETFDVLFNKEVSEFTHTVIFRSISDPSRLSIKNLGQIQCDRTVLGGDVQVTFGTKSPKLGTRYGFKADYQKNN